MALDANGRYSESTTGAVGFIKRHGLWDDRRRAMAEEIIRSLDSVDFVRVAFGDPHGLVRSKTVSADTFRVVLRNGMDFSPGPFVFDTGHAVAVEIFAEGGGVGIAELTGAGDFILVPDPLTYRILPHTRSRTGWVLGDEYLRDGSPHPLSSRRVLLKLIAEADARDLDFVVGLEVEWYLTRFADDSRMGTVGGFGVQGSAPAVLPVNAGYQFNLDGFGDALEPVIDPLAHALLRLGLPLRSFEHESGPGQLEFTFAPMTGLEAADAMLLFRTVTKQMCARLGYHASFMALPGIPGFDPSGWHLHQSLAVRSTGRNAFVAADDALLSELGRHYVGGLLDHAAASSILCVPTVNGYRRTQRGFALSPDRIGWAHENRGGHIRVMGASGDPATHVENRMGEPCANPYLYLASQLSAGLDGIDRRLDPGDAVPDPHSGALKPLPVSLREALQSFEADGFYPEMLGDHLAACLRLLKESELARYEEWLVKAGLVEPDVPTPWEHDEYFTAF
ncbi:glutamine synthetase family protein [Streptosporangium subroseum]|uniref:glutamine synthetase family protein n=1 Tax=Streptosporangium subroseum TaxID=106412 RepID=UPI00308D36A4|nr:glutamine synthetase family protein [Streptosporangium subroseum]